MVNLPEDYPWSSYHVNAGLKPRRLLKPHPSYLALERDVGCIETTYRALFSCELEQSTINSINNAATFNMPYGNDRFIQEIELSLGRSIGFDKVGRPKNTTNRT